MSLDGMRQEGQGVAALLAAGFHHRQHRLDEATAVDALGAEREFPPKDRVTQRAADRRRRCVRRRPPARPGVAPQGPKTAGGGSNASRPGRDTPLSEEPQGQIRPLAHTASHSRFPAHGALDRHSRSRASRCSAKRWPSHNGEAAIRARRPERSAARCGRSLATRTASST